MDSVMGMAFMYSKMEMCKIERERNNRRYVLNNDILLCVIVCKKSIDSMETGNLVRK